MDSGHTHASSNASSNAGAPRRYVITATSLHKLTFSVGLLRVKKNSRRSIDAPRWPDGAVSQHRLNGFYNRINKSLSQTYNSFYVQERNNWHYMMILNISADGGPRLCLKLPFNVIASEYTVPRRDSIMTWLGKTIVRHLPQSSLKLHFGTYEARSQQTTWANQLL